MNGLPWVVIELKKPGVSARHAFDENLTSYKHPQNGIPQLFWYSAFLIASNGTQSGVGTITAEWERFFDWKRIEREDEPRRVSLEVMLRGTCAPARLLDIAENFTLFSEHKSGLVKAMAQNHQYLGVNNTIAATLAARKAGNGRGGVFWQTQGSGKSFSMVFFAQKILRKVPGNWTFVVVTDRVELDDQIAKTFKACGGMYDKVRKHWPTMDSTDMAVVVSPGQNEIEQMKKLGLDIVPHRKRMNEQALDEQFKDPDDPLRLVFLCAMWLTGFDAPSCSTVYLDKPMRNHTLMQTIARANRVYPGKHSGVIVDYANVFASLERALAIYAKGRGGEMPVRDKKALVEELRKAVTEATAYCMTHGVDLARIEGTSVEKFERAQAVEDGANRLLAPEAVKRDFLTRARLVDALFGAVKPDPVAVEFATRCGSIRALADYIRNRSDPPDISHVMRGIQELLDGSIATEPFKIQERSGGYPAIDLSKIDFEVLAKRFQKQCPKNSDLERLKAAVRAQLERMVRLNRTRADYLEKFQQLIDDYNAGSRNIEEIFRDLLALSGALTQEQERHVREHLSEEELTIFDILTRPGPDLTAEEREEVKKAAKQLLTRLNALLVLGWRQKIQARAQVKLAIEDALDEGLPRAYTKDLYRSKCAALFEHVYESYLGDGASVYRDAA